MFVPYEEIPKQMSDTDYARFLKRHKATGHDNYADGKDINEHDYILAGGNILANIN